VNAPKKDTDWPATRKNSTSQWVKKWPVVKPTMDPGNYQNKEKEGTNRESEPGQYTIKTSDFFCGRQFPIYRLADLLNRY
jgi:hypothetical protein